ncbi:hypothetical protein KEM55_002087, partial [Ascosphaera atra]
SPNEGSGSAPQVFRKQGRRLEEAERENKKLQSAADKMTAKCRHAEKRLEGQQERSAELELLKMRLGAAQREAETMDKLRQEVRALESENKQLQTAAKNGKWSGMRPPAAVDTALKEAVFLKTATVEAMEVKISNLKIRLRNKFTDEKQCESLKGLLRSVEEEVERAQKMEWEACGKQAESEQAKCNVEALVCSLEQRLEEAQSTKSESDPRADSLEKKHATGRNLKRDAEKRQQARQRGRERLERESTLLKKQLAEIQAQILRLREERMRVSKSENGGSGDDGDAAAKDVEDEGRPWLERNVRKLEGEISDMRRGVWREKETELQAQMSEQHEWDEELDTFDDVDLMASSASLQQRYQQEQEQQKRSSLTTALSSGLAVFTGASVPQLHGYEDREEGLLDEPGFDETAFAIVQAEEEIRKRAETSKQVKRKLRDWKGWRLDLVDARLGAQGAAVGFGEIFEV